MLSVNSPSPVSVRVEFAWLRSLAAEPDISELPPLLSDEALAFRCAGGEFFRGRCVGGEKAIEATTNHDVKAVEYWIKDKFKALPELAPHAEFVHFACTSEDINNVSHALMLKRGGTACCCRSLMM